MIDFGLLRPMAAPGIMRSSALGKVELKAWLAQGRYRVDQISGSSERIVLHVVDSTPLVESFGYDYLRFASAAFESMRELKGDPNFPKATAWVAIRMYYSAFFAAHALLRYTGQACSQIDPEQAALVSKYAGVYGVAGNMGKGFYHLEWSHVSGDVTLEKVKDSHRDTWRMFDQWLLRIQELLPGLPGLSASKVQMLGLVGGLRANLQREGSNSGNWLSTFRNNINYRHSYDAWYPYKRSAVRFDQVSKYVDGWKLRDFNIGAAFAEKDDRAVFFGSCGVIMHLLNGLTADFLKSAAKGSLHVQQMPRLM